MSNYKEKRIGFIDLLHCRDQTDPNRPYLEGKIKVEKTGKVCYIKLWKEVKPNVTKNEKFSGMFYELIEEE